MWYEYAELESVMQDEPIVSINNELGAALCSNNTKNMLNSVTRVLRCDLLNSTALFPFMALFNVT